MAKVRASERLKDRQRKRALKRAKEQEVEVEKDSKKRRKRADAVVKDRLKQEDKRRMGRGPGDALAGTTGEGGEFEVIQGRHYDQESGTYYGDDEDAGKFLESDLPLDELFANKFKRVGQRTRLGRDERRDKVIDSNVMDKPLAQRMEDDEDEEFEDDEESEEEEEDAEDEDAEESEEEEEEAPRRKGKKVARADKADADEGTEANPMLEDDEGDEAVDKAARHRKAKRAKTRGKKK